MSPRVKEVKLRTKPIWHNKEGNPIRMSDMSIKHLINSFHLLKRMAREELIEFQQYCNEAYNATPESFCVQIYPEYQELRKEIVKRLGQFAPGSIGRKYWHNKFSNSSNS